MRRGYKRDAPFFTVGKGATPGPGDPARPPCLSLHVTCEQHGGVDTCTGPLLRASFAVSAVLSIYFPYDFLVNVFFSLAQNTTCDVQTGVHRRLVFSVRLLVNSRPRMITFLWSQKFYVDSRLQMGISAPNPGAAHGHLYFVSPWSL